MFILENGQVKNIDILDISYFYTEKEEAFGLSLVCSRDLLLELFPPVGNPLKAIEIKFFKEQEDITSLFSKQENGFDGTAVLGYYFSRIDLNLDRADLVVSILNSNGEKILEKRIKLVFYKKGLKDTFFELNKERISKLPYEEEDDAIKAISEYFGEIAEEFDKELFYKSPLDLSKMNLFRILSLGEVYFPFRALLEVFKGTEISTLFNDFFLRELILYIIKNLSRLSTKKFIQNFTIFFYGENGILYNVRQLSGFDEFPKIRDILELDKGTLYDTYELQNLYFLLLPKTLYSSLGEVEYQELDTKRANFLEKFLNSYIVCSCQIKFLPIKEDLYLRLDLSSLDRSVLF
jgi:hypothetical protein